MMQDLRDQAERFGTRFITDDATKIELLRRARRHPRRARGRQGDPHARRGARHGRRAEEAGRARRGRAGRARRLLLRHLRRRLLPRPRDDRRRRRRHRDGGRDLPGQVRRQGRHRPPPPGVPRLGDHAPARARTRTTSSCSRPYVVAALRARRERRALEGGAGEHRGRLDQGASRSRAPSSRSATGPTRSSSRASWTSTTRATCWSRAAPRAPSCRACSPPAT